MNLYVQGGGNVKETDRVRDCNSFYSAGLIAHHQNHQVITPAHTPFYFNYRHKAPVCVCVWTEMECEWRLFGHGSKPDGKVWVIAALGDDITHMHAHTHTSVHQWYGLTGRGGLMLHWCQNAVSFPAASPAAGWSWERSALRRGRWQAGVCSHVWNKRGMRETQLSDAWQRHTRFYSLYAFLSSSFLFFKVVFHDTCMLDPLLHYFFLPVELPFSLKFPFPVHNNNSTYILYLLVAAHHYVLLTLSETVKL